MAVTVVARNDEGDTYKDADSWIVDGEGYLHLLAPDGRADRPSASKGALMVEQMAGPFSAKYKPNNAVATYNRVAWQFVQKS